MFRNFETPLDAAVAGVIGCTLGPVVFDHVFGPLLLGYGGLGALVVGKYPLVIGIDVVLSTLIFAGLRRSG